MNPTVIFNNEEDVNVNVDNIYDIPDFVRAEEERKSNEIRRETYYENFIERVENGEFKGDAALINGVNTLNIEAGTNISLQQTNGTLTINNTYSYNDSQINQKITNLELEQTTQNNNIQTNASLISSINNTLPNLATKSEIPTKTSDLINDSNFANTNDIPTDLSQLSNATTQFVNQNQMTSAINTEQTSRQNADINLQSQIDAITVSSDVVDVVGTYSDLQNYSTSSLTDDDIVKVLEDSTHNNALSYYRWVITSNVGSWQYVGSEGPFYTKSEADANLTNYVQNTDYATGSTAGVFKSANSLAVNGTGQVQAQTLDFETYSSRANTIFVGKGTLENVIAGKKLINQTTLDETEEEINTTLTNQEQEILLNSEDIKLLATELEDNTVEIEAETQITDSANYYGNVDKISGEEITQKTYTGKNKFNLTQNNTTYNNVTTQYKGSEFILNGTTSSGANIISPDSNTLFSIGTFEAGTYAFTLITNSGYNANEHNSAFYLRKSDFNIVKSRGVYANDNFTSTFTLEEDSELFVQIYSNSGNVVFDDYHMYFQIELGSATDYEPYVGGISSPNPDYPQDIETTTGLQEIKLQNKNLFDGELEIGGLGGSGEETTSSNCRSKNYIEINSNETYTLSADTNENIALRFYDENKNYISSGTSAVSPNTFATPNNAKYLRFMLVNNTDLSTQCQLEKDLTATTHIEHQEQNFEVNLGNIELCKIGTYQDYIYKNNGNWYLHQEIGKVVLDGSESWQSEAAANGYYRYNASSYLNVLSSNAMNNRFTERINQGHGEYEYCYVQNDVGSVHIQLLQNRISSSSVNDFKNWLSNNKVDLYYILSTPTNTLITSENYPELYEQLQEISKFLMYQGVNNFSITSENLKAKLNLTYKRSNLLRLKSLESTINGLIDGDEVNY